MSDRILDLQRPRTGSESDAAASAGHRRAIGPVGTTGRIILGGAMVGSVVWGHARSGPDLWAWLIGLFAMPALTIVWQRWRAGRHPERLVWLSGPIGHPATAAAFMALYLTPWYAPAISVLSDSALIFYGTTMLVAAGRGYSRCEVLAISNWVLNRDDQVGCLLFELIDRRERPS